MPFFQSSLSISAVSLISLLCITTASCAKKHSRGKPDEVRITAGSQTGGTEPQAGAEQPLGGIGGNAESTGGISDNTGGTNTGGTSGNDKIGGTGGAPIALPIAGEMGGSAGEGGFVSFPEGGSGGNAAGVMVVEPVGGTGGDETAAAGNQNEGGQGGNTGNAGGIIIPEPEPRELRYAPTPWPMSPELGLQTLTDFETCGNVPFVDLQPLFEEVIDDRMDPIDPDTGEREANHWVYKGPISFVNKTYAFAWTAERAGKYRFQISSQNIFIDGHDIWVSPDCPPRAESLSHNNDIAPTYPPFTPNVADAWATLEPNQTAYVFPQTIAERLSRDVPMLLQVFRQVEAEPPVLDEVFANRTTSFIEFAGIDPNADAMQMEMQFLREPQGEPVPPFVDENGQWLEENDELYWIPRDISGESQRTISAFKTWGARSFVGGHNLSFPPLLDTGDFTHVRLRLCDLESLCSNIVEVELLNDGEPVLNGSCYSDVECLPDQVCRYSEDAAANREIVPYRCTDVVPSIITEALAYRTDDSLMLSIQAESANQDMTMFAVQVMDAEGTVVFNKGYSPFLDTNRFEKFDAEIARQTHFKRQVHIHFDEIGTSDVARVRVTGQKYAHLLWSTIGFRRDSTEPVEIDIEEMPLRRLSEECDQAGITNQCEIGTACASGPLEESTCQQATIPSIESGFGELFETSNLIHLDLTVTGDVIGYRLRDVEGISENQISFVQRIDNIDEQKHAFIKRSVSRNTMENNRPEHIEAQVVHRNGYSSEWFEIELDFVPEDPGCRNTGCEDGFHCARDNTRDYICKPLPSLPIFERGSSLYNPKTHRLIINAEGRFEGQSIDLTANPHAYLLDGNEFILLTLRAPVEGSVVVEINPLDDTRFSLEIAYDFKASPLGKPYTVHFDQVSQVQLTYFMPTYRNGILVSNVNYPTFENLVEDEISMLRMQFEIVQSRNENENCDPQLLTDYCEGTLQCTNSEEGPHCEISESPFCNLGALTADLNQFQDPEREDQWSISNIDTRINPSVAIGSCSNEISLSDHRAQVFRFTPPVSANYLFEHIANYGSNRGPRMWIRRQCNVPESEIICRAKDHGVRVSGGDGYTRAVSAIVHLDPEDGPVYIFASHSGQESRGSYNLTVEQFVPPTILESGPNEGQSEETVVFFNRETGAVEFYIDTSSLGSARNLRDIHLEYQTLDENGDPIAFEGDPNTPDDNRDTWKIEDYYLGSPNAHRIFDEYRFKVSHLPLLEPRIQEVRQFRVWLQAGQSRSNIITLNPQDPQIRGRGGCDFYGLTSRCSEGLICRDPECGQDPSMWWYEWQSNNYGRSSDTFCLEDVNPQCPVENCVEGWILQELIPVPEQPNQWEIQNVFAAQDPSANMYQLRGGCRREEGQIFEREEEWTFQSGSTHTYPFTAEIPGRYQFQFSTDTSLRKAGHFRASSSYHFDWLALAVRDQCMNSASELGCISWKQYTGDARGVTLDLTQNQTVYIHVSHDDPELTTPWPYTLQVERIK